MDSMAMFLKSGPARLLVQDRRELKLLVAQLCFLNAVGRDEVGKERSF